MAISAIGISPERAREVDLPFPWQISGFGLIIPFPEASASMSAPWKTFDVKVNI
jgi:hypothetical protein